MNLQQLISATPNLIYLRDSEVVLYKRSSTPIYQCRFKLADKGWVRVSTHKASLEGADGWPMDNWAYTAILKWQANDRERVLRI